MKQHKNKMKNTQQNVWLNGHITNNTESSQDLDNVSLKTMIACGSRSTRFHVKFIVCVCVCSRYVENTEEEKKLIKYKCRYLCVHCTDIQN